MLKQGDKGALVNQLQQALLSLGYTLPRFGPDGDLGGETLAAFGRFLRDHASGIVDYDPTVVTDLELAWLYDVVARSKPPAGMVDRRQFATREHDEGQRPWTQVTGICLHQTACRMGEREQRYDNIGAHFVVTRAGKRLRMHDLTRRIVSANGFNARCVSIEVDGLYAGVEGDLSTAWDDKSTPQREQPDSLTLASIESTKSVIRWIVHEVAAHGGKVTALVAHRQSSSTRRSDPGQAIWQSIALPMMDELDLSDGGIGFAVTYPGKPSANGMPIPEAWDSRCKGIRY